MSMNLNLGVRTITALSYVLLLALAGGAGPSKTGNAIQRVPVSAPAIVERSIGEMVRDGSPFLLGMALCGFLSGIAGAVIVQKTERVVRTAERKRFAGMVATALPTIAVRLGTSSDFSDSQPLIFRHTAAAKPLAHV